MNFNIYTAMRGGMEAMMNKEYQERMQRAEDATNEFFEEVKRTGNMEMLENDQEIREMYFKAFDVASDASDSEIV